MGIGKVKMKIGLFITGHIRNSPRTYENYAQFLDGHDTDVYIGTWSTYDLHRSNHIIINEPENIDKSVRPIFGDKIKTLWVGDMEKFLNEESPCDGSPPRTLWSDFIKPEDDLLRWIYPWPQRTMDQWYVVYELFKSSVNLKLYNSYDVCIRIRNDMTFLNKPKIPFEDISEGIHVNGINWWHHPHDRGINVVDGTNLVPYALSDQLAWGTPHWMLKHFEHYKFFAPLWAGRANWTNWCPQGTLPPEHRSSVERV